MIITNCAVCAAPLAHEAPRCVRCKTRYCNSTCQHDHWRRGHKEICKKIHRGDNAEQYYADKKNKGAVAVVDKKCAEDTKGQTCYICTEAVHWKTKEGLVRGCACRGTSGFAHVSCLAEQAKIFVVKSWLCVPHPLRRFKMVTFVPILWTSFTESRVYSAWSCILKYFSTIMSTGKLATRISRCICFSVMITAQIRKC